MTIREHIRIQTSPEQIWPLIADPICVADWNPKLVAVDRPNAGPLRLGERYRVTFLMAGRERGSECEVIESREPSELVIRYRPEGWQPDKYVDEHVTLKALAVKTLVVQEIDFSNSGVPRLLQVLMWAIHRIGTPIGKRYLESLKQIAEREL